MPHSWLPRPLAAERVLGLDLSVREGAIEPPEASPTSAEGRGGALAVPDAPAVEPPATTHRQLFETRFHPRTEDERARLATAAEDPDLSALCFDPVPAVIHRVLENSRAVRRNLAAPCRLGVVDEG